MEQKKQEAPVQQKKKRLSTPLLIFIILMAVTAVLCALSVLCGGLLAGPMLPPLPGAMAVAACFGGVLLAVGAACWQGVTWTGHGGVLLACALGGGLLSGILTGSRRGRRRKRK